MAILTELARGCGEIGQAGGYQIPKRFAVAPDKQHIDFGHCPLRLLEAGPTVT